MWRECKPRIKKINVPWLWFLKGLRTRIRMVFINSSPWYQRVSSQTFQRERNWNSWAKTESHAWIPFSKNCLRNIKGFKSKNRQVKTSHERIQTEVSKDCGGGSFLHNSVHKINRVQGGWKCVWNSRNPELSSLLRKLRRTLKSSMIVNILL